MGLLFCFLGAISFGLLGSALKAAERKKADAAGLVVAAYAWPAMIMLVQDPASQIGWPHSAPRFCDRGHFWNLCRCCVLSFSSVHQHRQGHGGLADDESVRRRSRGRFDLRVPREADASENCGVRSGARLNPVPLVGASDGKTRGQRRRGRRMNSSCGSC